jgi:hypothetical protein
MESVTKQLRFCEIVDIFKTKYLNNKTIINVRIFRQKLLLTDELVYNFFIDSLTDTD